MNQKEAVKLLKSCAVPAEDVEKGVWFALDQTRTWNAIKPRLAKNLKGKIDWSTHIYRTLPLTSFLRLLIDHTCLFSRPSVWEDPYENFWLRHLFVDPHGEIISFDSIAKEFYAQCWSMNPDSAALWKTTTTDPVASSAIRIESTIEEYCRALCSGICVDYLSQIEEHIFVGKVNYREQSFINKKLGEILTRRKEQKLVSNHQLQDNAVDSLLMKRKAFSFEEEVRFIFDLNGILSERLFLKSTYGEAQNTQLIQVNDNIANFVLSVEINPWCEDYEADVLKKVVKMFLPKCVVRKSNLLECDVRIPKGGKNGSR